MTRLLGWATTAMLLLALCGCAGRADPPMSPPANPPIAPPVTPSASPAVRPSVSPTVSPRATRATTPAVVPWEEPLPPDDEALSWIEIAARFNALQRFYNEEPLFRDLIGDVRELRRGAAPTRSPFPPMHYVRFTVGEKIVYGHWTSGLGYYWASVKSDGPPYYVGSEYRRVTAKYPAVPMTEEQRALFLRDVEAWDSWNEPEDLEVAKRGRGWITTVVGAEHVLLDPSPLMLIYDPKSDTVFSVDDSN